MMTSRDEQYRRLSESRNRKPLYEFALSTKKGNEDWTFRMLFPTDAEAAAKGLEWVADKFCDYWKVEPIKTP